MNIYCKIKSNFISNELCLTNSSNKRKRNELTMVFTLLRVNERTTAINT